MYHNQEIMTSWNDSIMTKEEFENKQLKDLVIEDDNKPLVILSESAKLRIKLNEINQKRKQGYKELEEFELSSQLARDDEENVDFLKQHPDEPSASVVDNIFVLRDKLRNKIKYYTNYYVDDTYWLDGVEFTLFTNNYGEYLRIELNENASLVALSYKGMVSAKFSLVDIEDFLSEGLIYV